jgi:hypothetical protein
MPKPRDPWMKRVLLFLAFLAVVAIVASILGVDRSEAEPFAYDYVKTIRWQPADRVLDFNVALNVLPDMVAVRSVSGNDFRAYLVSAREAVSDTVTATFVPKLAPMSGSGTVYYGKFRFLCGTATRTDTILVDCYRLWR